GGVGEVFEGIQKALDRRVAIKLLRPELTIRPEVVARFEQEARTTCRLQHPNVVTVFDVGQGPNGARFLVMELLEGVTLAQLMRNEGPLPWGRAVNLAMQIAKGMGAGQVVGLVHRDLKPENIFVLGEGGDEQVKILDFGLAFLQEQNPSPIPPPQDIPKALQNSMEQIPRLRNSLETMAPADSLNSADHTWDGEGPLHSQDVPIAATPTERLSDGLRERLNEGLSEDLYMTPADPVGAQSQSLSTPSRLTSPGSLVGTPRYMSPEQALCWRVDHRADLYAFGCMLFELLAGRAPFEEDSIQDYLQAHVHKEPPPLAHLAPESPDALLELCYRLLEKDPGKRPDAWAQVITELSALQRAPGPPRSRPPPPVKRPGEPYRFLSPFTESTSGLFFGRDADTKRFVDVWEHSDRTPMLALTGRSGVGKTSFLSARVLPYLAQQGHEVLVVHGGQRPLEHLKSQAERLISRSSSGESSNVQELGVEQVFEQLSQHLGRPICLFLDQFEELFTGGEAYEQQAFAEALGLMLRTGSQVRLILSLREDYLGALMRILDGLPLDQVLRPLPLSPLTPKDAREALEGPGRMGLEVDYPPFSFQEGLVDEIVADLVADDAGELAPRIQAIGSRLWELAKNSDPVHITQKHYRNGLGGAQGILARILDQAIEGLEDQDQNQAKEILRALTHLPGSATSRPAPESELLRGVQDVAGRHRVLGTLESRWRILQGYSDPRFPGERSYRIAHESLIHRIQQYGEDDGELNAARHKFQLAFDVWLRGGKEDKDLLPVEFFDVVQRHADDLVLRSEAEWAFLRASRVLHNDTWLKNRIAAKRRDRQRKLGISALPIAFIAIGVVLGQLPVDFVSFNTIAVKMRSAMHMEKSSLRGRNLAHADLPDAFLLGADLRGANLRQADLSGADLEQVNFQGADLRGADLSNTNLRAANLTGALLEGAKFDGADLFEANMETETGGATFRGARFNRMDVVNNMKGTQWGALPPQGALGPLGMADGEDFTNGNFPTRMNVAGISMIGTSLQGARFGNGWIFDGAQMRELDAADAQMEGAGFQNAHLEKADFQGANLRSIKAMGAHMNNANLRKADLREAQLPGVFLEGADLRDADLRGANLLGAHLDGALLKGAWTDRNTLWPSTVDAEKLGVVQTP
ncbi:MAG: hypothetical protein ACI9VR_004390, partial [Cognaticolwellia sp.]